MVRAVMTESAAVGPATSGGADGAAVAAGFTDRVIWGFLAGGIVVAVLALAIPNTDLRSFIYDSLSLVAAGGAVCGIIRNQPRRRGTWQLFAFGLVLIAAGDVVYDVAIHAFGRVDGYPFADVLYLLSYPVMAVAIVQLARSRFDRATVIDSVLVAVALSAVMWHWVITPVFASTSGSTMERLVTVAYPLMDILLVVAIVYAVFTLPRWNASATLMFAGLTLMLIADAVYARLVADGTYVEGTALDALWPISYLVLAAAVMHPSMQRVELVQPPTSGTTSRADPRRSPGAAIDSACSHVTRPTACTSGPGMARRGRPGKTSAESRATSAL